MTIGKTISTIRKQKNISQKELARRCGLPLVALSNIENERTIPSRETIEALAIGLDVPMESLLLMSLDSEETSHEKRSLYREMKDALI